MIHEYSKEEMLDLWRLRRGLQPQRTDCTVVRTDGVDIDGLLGRQIDDWYLNLLDTAPVEMLPVTEMRTRVEPVLDENGSVDVILPDVCRRLVSVKLKGWQREARIVSDMSSTLAGLQLSPYVRGGCVDPVALQSGRRLKLYSAAGDSVEIESLLCVNEPENGLYTLDTRLIATIPSLPLEY